MRAPSVPRGGLIFWCRALAVLKWWGQEADFGVEPFGRGKIQQVG